MLGGWRVFNKGGLLGWRMVCGVVVRLNPWLCVVCCVLVLDHVPQSTARVCVVANRSFPCRLIVDLPSSVAPRLHHRPRMSAPAAICHSSASLTLVMLCSTVGPIDLGCRRCTGLFSLQRTIDPRDAMLDGRPPSDHPSRLLLALGTRVSSGSLSFPPPPSSQYVLSTPTPPTGITQATQHEGTRL